MKKIALITLALILALGTMGVGYALWSETLVLSGTAAMGELDWEFYNPADPSNPNLTCQDNGPDPLLAGYNLYPGKDVASTTGVFSDSDGDGDYDTLTITINCAYPGYYNHCSFWVHCNGCVPLHIEEYLINGVPLPAGVPYDIFGNGALEIVWGDGPGTQLHFCQSEDISFSIHVLQPAVEGATYTFTISLIAVQYNESAFPVS